MKYVKPELEITKFSVNDIITASGDGTNDKQIVESFNDVAGKEVTAGVKMSYDLLK